MSENIIQLKLPFAEQDNEPIVKAIYLAGPMGGYPDLNHKAFNEAAEALREDGWDVFNPADLDVEVYGTVEEAEKAMTENRQEFLRDALAADLQFICIEADAIAMLPGWEKSYGARAEHATAVALGLEIIYLSS